MIIRFKPYVKVLLNESNKEVILSRPMKDGDHGDKYELSDMGLEMIRYLVQGISRQKLIENLKLESQDEKTEFEEILELLTSMKYIGYEEENANEKYKDIEQIYGRLIPLWGEIETKDMNRYDIQKSIMSKKVGIIGCGTIGMGIISKLVTVGIGNFVLVDNDVVSRTNLTRQCSFTLKDIGKSKVEVAKKFIQERLENNKIDIYNKKITSVEDLNVMDDVDIIVVASDEQQVDTIIQKYSIHTGIAVSYSGGYTGNTGKIFPVIIPNINHQYDCIIDYLQRVEGKSTEGYREINNGFKVSSNSSISEFISSIASFEIIKFLTGTTSPYLMDKVLFFNFSNYGIEEITIDNAHCSCIRNGSLPLLQS
ncbi:ThiF family adenylyltransferase [Falsibacillus albus]|uniref:ThiF family adenylyltransferase n=1 Tax=Falsibacillus albus TaxID=2478915 RepID=UPI0013142A44|nr:ThiF family adenylyltransferase [Falsibacillus albus]